MAIRFGILNDMGVRTTLFCVVATAVGFCVPAIAHASVADDIAAKQQQIEQLQQQIEQFQAQADAAGQQSQTLQSEIARLNAQIGALNAEIKQLSASIDQTGMQIQQTSASIDDTQRSIDLQSQALAKYLQETDRADRQSLAQIVLQHNAFSDFFDYVHNIQLTQENLRSTIQTLATLQDTLDQHRQDLQGKQDDLQRLKDLQETQKQQLAGTKGTKNQLLQTTKGQESKYQQLVKQTKQDLQKLQDQIAYLLQNGLSVEDAVKYAHLAAIGAGIRPQFLLAELEQESKMGVNVGKCYIVDATSGATRRITNGQIYAKGIHPTRDLPLFLSITAQLGKDPFQTPISCGSSWGGAMGPAQFIPSTWMGYTAEIAQITGHTLPDPWNIEDAIVAAAAKFSKDGASSQTRAGEVAASKRYYCGSATSRSASCIAYANSVQLLAADIGQNL
jgi:peptidoglycan hydrolase CwlO-like protein